MIYDKAKTTTWCNVETKEILYGVALKSGKKWHNCADWKSLILFSSRDKASDYMSEKVRSIKGRGLWVEK